MREEKRKNRGETLKKQLDKLGVARMKEDQEKARRLQEDWERKMQNEGLRAAYFDMQKRNIEDFRL